ncbi:unnamed protein product [Adineta ricciae]|uniref:phosphoglycerate mutase (2,3-diphosphoglycerate-dependent) n=1 Tax=Adineta ricciae TaxID=249248 RepID=A0A813RI74_ADIRI|nr:unnamed protein product [Adineta ricciae]
MPSLLFIVFCIGIIFEGNNAQLSSAAKLSQSVPGLITYPDSLDWQTNGVVTPVQDYLDISYMNAVVMVETIESLHAIATGTLQRGSIARVMDCCATNMTYGCIKSFGGICTYDDYPNVLGKCQTSACQPFASFDTVDEYYGLNDTALLQLTQKSTLFVGFYPPEQIFLRYKGGIFQETNCSKANTMYALQLVGYDNTQKGDLYWTAKNHWGKDWGESGYIRILRGANICGFGSLVYQPVVSAITTTAKSMPITTNSNANNHPPDSVLILVRHGTSDDEFNKRFSGWNDCDLSLLGQQQMSQTGRVLRQANLSIDICFTSLLKRASKSLFIIQEEIDHLWAPTYNIWRLNDRMLGNLTSFHQDRAESLFGQHQIRQWLTQPNLAPPPFSSPRTKDPRFAHLHRYSSFSSSTETLIDVHKRVQPFVYDQLLNHLHRRENVLLVTHADIIKTIIRLIHSHTPDYCHDHEIPISTPIIFQFSLDINSFYNAYYLSTTLFENNTDHPYQLFPTGFERIKTASQYSTHSL